MVASFSTVDDSRAVCLSPDGGIVAVISDQNAQARAWKVNSGELVIEGIETGNDFAYSPSGNRIAVAGGWSKEFRLLDDDWQTLITVERRFDYDPDSGDMGDGVGHSGYVSTVAFSPDGSDVASASLSTESEGGIFLGDGVRIWDAASGRFIKALNKPGFSRRVTMNFSPDGGLLLVGYRRGFERMRDGTWENQETGSFVVWNIRDGQSVCIERIVGSQPEGLAFSNSGETVFIGDHKDLRVFDAHSCEQLDAKHLTDKISSLVRAVGKVFVGLDSGRIEVIPAP